MHEQASGLDEQGLLALARSLRALAGWLGLDQVWFNSTSASATRLRVHLD